MKTIIISIIMMLACVNNSNIYAQNVVREGNVFKSVSSRSTHKADTLITNFVFQDSKGVKYPIIINKGNGRCYVWRVSREGRKYRSSMKEDISKAICKELNIEYKPKNRK